MPEEEVVHALGAGEKPGSVNHIRSSIHNRLQQLWIIPRVILEIGILNQHDIAGRFGKSASQSSTLPLIRPLREEPKVVQAEGAGPSWVAAVVALLACNAAILSRISRVPSLESSSTMITSLAISAARTRPKYL